MNELKTQVISPIGTVIKSSKQASTSQIFSASGILRMN